MSAFTICSTARCVCSFRSKVRPRPLGALPWVVLCCLLLGPDIFCRADVNMQVVLSGFSKRLFCFVQAKLYVGMLLYFLAALVLVCVDVIVMSSA